MLPLRSVIARSSAAVVLAAAPLLFAGAPARAATPPVSFTVNAFNDEVDAHPGDGVCRTASGTCTLRAAIQEADAAPLTPHAIVLPAGRITLTIKTQWPLPSQTADLKVDPSYGELNVFGAVTIRGAGADRTTINVNGVDRGFSVAPTGNLSASDLTITGGDATVNDKTPADIAIGGAILDESGGLTLDRVALVGNKADGGGGVFATPFTNITVRNSLIAHNQAIEGGGLRLDGGATIVNSTITGNSLFTRVAAQYLPDQITGYGGGIDHRGSGPVSIVNSTITHNSALKAGGGYSSGQDYAPVPAFANSWPYRTMLVNTVISDNTVSGAVDNCHVASMVIQSLGHNLADDGSCFLTAAGDQPNTAPRLGSLADNGGPTETQLPEHGSPLVDAGDNGRCPATDQRGISRPQGPACDIGAVEVVEHSQAPGSASPVPPTTATMPGAPTSLLPTPSTLLPPALTAALPPALTTLSLASEHTTIAPPPSTNTAVDIAVAATSVLAAAALVTFFGGMPSLLRALRRTVR